jgi:hypothetical protein
MGPLERANLKHCECQNPSESNLSLPQSTHGNFVTKTARLILYMDTIALYSERDKTPLEEFCLLGYNAV